MPAKKGGLFENQVQVQDGAQADSEVGVLPRRSERLKEKNQKVSVSSKCVPLMMMPLSSGSLEDLTGFTANRLPRKCKLNRNQTLSDKMQEDFLFLTSSG